MRKIYFYSFVFFHCFQICKSTNLPFPQADEFLMTSMPIDGIKRSNICGDGYRIDGALLKSYPFSTSETYAPNEDCSMTFQARRSNYKIRIRILFLDLNDIHDGTNCFDALKFYQSFFIRRKDKLTSIECGKLSESDRFNVISPTGIVTAHFSTDGGNVNGVGFKVVLTAFRSANKTHPCNPDDDEYQCHQGDCISSSLLCDGVPHCLDSSDENPIRSCRRNAFGFIDDEQRRGEKRIRQHQHWRGILIIAFLLIILLAFAFFLIYLVCRRFCSFDDTERTRQIQSNGPTRTTNSSKL